MNELRTKPFGPLTWLAARTWRFWIVVTLLPVLYVTSLGVVGWMVFHQHVSAVPLAFFYYPILKYSVSDYPTGGLWAYLRWCGAEWGCLEMLIKSGVLRQEDFWR